MELDNGFGDIESDASAFDADFGGILGAEEFGENAVELVGGDADALIRDRGVDCACVVVDSDANDDFTLRSIFDGIINKIIEYFLHTHGIDRDRVGKIFSRIEVNLDAFVSSKDVELFNSLGDKFGPVNIFFVKGHGVAFDFGGREERFHNFGELFGTGFSTFKV